MGLESRNNFWETTQERAKELIQIGLDDTDLSKWMVHIQSTHQRVSLSKFIQACSEALADPSHINHRPKKIAMDQQTVLEQLPILMEKFRNRFENAFSGMLLVNEDIYEFIKGKDAELAKQEKLCEEFREQNKELLQQLYKVLQSRMDTPPIIDASSSGNLNGEVIVDETVKFPDGDPSKLSIPPKFQQFPPDLYWKAVEQVPHKSKWRQSLYETEIRRCINCLEDGTEYEPIN